MLIKALEGLMAQYGQDYEDRLGQAMMTEMGKVLTLQGKEVHHFIMNGINVGEGEKFEDVPTVIRAVAETLRSDSLPSPSFVEHGPHFTASYYVGPHYFLWIGEPHNRTNVSIKVVTDEEHFSALLALQIELNEPEQPKPKLHALTQNAHSVDVDEIGSIEAPFRETNYTAEVASHFVEIVTALKSGAPSGKLIILEGKPGTGKTWFVKGLITAMPELKWTLIPSSMVESVAEPHFIPALIRAKNNSLVYWYKQDGSHMTGTLTKRAPLHVLIVEDGDRCLLPRETDNLSAISTLLNLSDGLIGSALNLAVLVTTNVSIKRKSVGLAPSNGSDLNVDPALLRAGRMLAHVQIPTLSRDHANAIFRREGIRTELTGQGTLTLAEVYEQIAKLKQYRCGSDRSDTLDLPSEK